MKEKKIMTWKWAPPEWLEDPVPDIARFHDVDVEVYEGKVRIQDIKIWRQNFRTQLDLEHLRDSTGKGMDALDDEEIISYVFKEGLHNIPPLAGSIDNNGVREALILSHDQELLDGNRRFLACKYLERKGKSPQLVPVKCISPNVTEEIKLKIIAEMNFLPQHKEPWPRYVRAQFALKEFERFKEVAGNEDDAYENVSYYLDIKPSQLKLFRTVHDLIKEYVEFSVKEASEKARQDAERFGRTKFHFYEEFANKGLSGVRSKIPTEIQEESKQLLYRYIHNKQITSIDNVRSLVKVVRCKPSLEELQAKHGSLLVAEDIYKECTFPRQSTDRINRFCNWLGSLSTDEKKRIPSELKKELLNAVEELLEQEGPLDEI